VASKDANGEFLLQNEMLRYPVQTPGEIRAESKAETKAESKAESKAETKAETKGEVHWRYVHVRPGRHHTAKSYELVHREPAGGGTVYPCELWN